MQNRAFMRLWAPIIAALVFAVAFLATHFILNPAEKASAAAELNALLDTADARVEAEKEGMTAFDGDADATAIHKARTVERFLAHDDTLLQTDALIVLCELIDLKAAAITDAEGSITAASDAAMIGTSVSADDTAAWCLDLLAEGAEPAAGASGQFGRLAAMPRTDTEGLILVWNEDALLRDVSSAADIRGAVENLAVAPDAIKLVETTGEDGIFEQDGTLYVQRALEDVTLIAYRPLSKVHAVQNAVLTSLAVFAAVTLAAMFIWQLTGKPDQPVPDAEDGDVYAEESAEAETFDGDAPLLPEPEPEPEPEDEEPAPKPRRRKRRKPLIEIVEEDGAQEPAYEDDAEAEPAWEESEQTPELPPRKRKGRSRKAERPAANDEDFDKIFE